MQTRAGYDDWSVERLRDHAVAQMSEARTTLLGIHGVRARNPLKWDADETLTVVIPFIARDERQDEVEADREIAREIELALVSAKSKAYAARLTLDALVDKGEAGAGLARETLAPVAAFTVRADAYATVEEWIQYVESALSIVKP